MISALSGVCARGLLAGLALSGVAGWSLTSAWGQGCVAVRGSSQCLAGVAMDPAHQAAHLEGGNWQLALGYRWLRSDRHFRGGREEADRQANETEVVNESHFFDLSVTYAISPRFSAALILPFVASDRASLYEHKGNASGERYHTQAGGLADVRVAAYGWLWDPMAMPRGNVQLGVGLKAPTGEKAATDIFQRPAGPTLDYVDQSIQPGDGGWGCTVEGYAWRELFARSAAYAQGSYLFNPENHNGVPTRIANLNSADPDTRMSVSDQYLLRAGLAYHLIPSWGLTVSLGGRWEGVPVEDVLGASDGFRRPGFAVSVEPGIGFMKRGWSVSLSAPVALYRNRERSVPDRRNGRHGDAAFADFVILTSVAKEF
ncbi:MAG: hypothetical protein FJ387_12260 [Verrucomicrobia bacterium]|nr:hypothetical protein [Verrucomicrobiota bacterium]